MRVLQRYLLVMAYFFCGVRKLCTTGLKWADGRNLQFFFAVQGLCLPTH